MHTTQKISYSSEYSTHTYLSQEHLIYQFVSAYIQLCEQYKLQLSSSLNVLTLNDLQHDTMIQDIQTAAQDYINTIA